MPTRIFSIVEVDAENDSYVIINGQWWSPSYNSGSPGNDSTEVGIADYGEEPYWYVTRVETRKMSDVSIPFRHLVARAVAGRLEEKNELLEFERLD